LTKLQKFIRQPRKHIVQIGQLFSRGATPGPVVSTEDGQTSPPLLSPSSRSAAPKLRALTILDEISEHSWKGAFKLERLLRKGFPNQIANKDASFLFLESCWKGGGGKWEYAFTSPGLAHGSAVALLEAIDLAKQQGLPVVFWNKEDPMHFERFLPVARHASAILTTDENMVPAYREQVPGVFVETLPFAAHPAICNPTGRFRTEPESVCFAGAYYPEFHDERLRQMDYVLPAIETFGGAIYDRYSNLTTDRYRFPDRYQPFIRSSVPFSELVHIYKRFKVFLNVNTIVGSPTMMARRVYELLASGTPVVSPPSAALAEQFPDIVTVGETEAEIRDAVGKLLDDQDHWERVSHRGYREVFKRHTYKNRSAVVERAAGFTPRQKEPPLVSIVMASRRPKNLARMIENVRRQNYPRIEVIFVITPEFSIRDRAALQAVADSAPHLRQSRVLVLGDSVTLGQCLNAAVTESKGDFIAKMDDDNLYFDDFLSDLMLAFQIGDFDVVGKESHFCYLGGRDQLIWRVPRKRHSRTKFVCGDAMIIRRRVFEKTSFPAKRVGEDTKFLRDVVALGGTVYAADPFNFIKVRTGDLADHTWKVEEEQLMKDSFVVAQGLEVGKAII
jgi:spore maturation protein CgeB